jgi:hypothetical protein
MGPGLAFKSAGGRWFSLMVFGFSQVLIDLEPLVGLIRGAPVLHGFTHAWVGATVIGLVAAAAGPPVCELVARVMRRQSVAPTVAGLPWPDRISWRAGVVGAFAGTYSHILLDGMMHLDMYPWAPFQYRNGLLGLFSIPSIYLLCVVCGLVAGGVMRVTDHWR